MNGGMDKVGKSFRFGLPIVVAFGMVAGAVKAETATDQTFVRLPPVPDHVVELDRHRAATSWNSRFCTKWTDDCSRCFKQHPLSDGAFCERMEADGKCALSPIRCLDFDPVISPLFCAGLRTQCGEADLTGDFLPASLDRCLPRKERPPIDWTCRTMTMVRDECRKSPGVDAVKDCVKNNLVVLRRYRRTVERLVRESRRHELH